MISEQEISVVPDSPKVRRCAKPSLLGHAPWGPSAVNAAKTHCIHGHEFTKENTVWQRRNGRVAGRGCRTCRNERAKLRARQSINNNATYRRQRALKQNYGLTIEQYDEMVSRQNGLCLICRKPPSGGRGRRLYVDHCHETKIVRGLLCNRCNSAIGLLDEDAARMKHAANYVLEFQHKLIKMEEAP